MKLQGIFPALATPFNYEGNLYKAKIFHNIEKFNQVALTGYVVGGSTGEAVFLSLEERIQLWQWVREASAEGKVLIAGTGAESVRETIQLTNHAAEIGYQAALVLTPHYYRGLMPKMETQALFFRAVADQSKLPVLIYNMPRNTGIDLDNDLILELSHHPNIIGIKDSSGNVEKVAQLVKGAKPGFQVLVGSATTLWASLQAGAVGGVLAFANPAPYACVTIWEAFRTRETAAGEDWQQRITLAAQMVTTKHGIPGLKHAMDWNGYYGGPPRLPLIPPDAAAKAEIEQSFDGIKS